MGIQPMQHAIVVVVCMSGQTELLEIWREWRNKKPGKDRKGISRDYGRGGGETKQGKKGNKGGLSRTYKRDNQLSIKIKKGKKEQTEKLMHAAVSSIAHRDTAISLSHKVYTVV